MISGESKEVNGTNLKRKGGPLEIKNKIQFKTTLNETDDKRIKSTKPLIPPQILMEDFPLEDEVSDFILSQRNEAENIVNGIDDRLLVVVGPCSIHNVEQALEYAKNLTSVKLKLQKNLLIVMRVYFEKPRTTVGWKGLINDPFMDGSFQINKGLKLARKLLLDINTMGLPCGVEFLDTLTPQYIGDTITWGAIGARTTESQIHRELSSGLSVPVGFKNGTDGSVQVAIDAIKSASSPHHFLGVTKQGLSAIVETSGNKSCHLILRGSNSGPNYEKKFVTEVIEKLKKNGTEEKKLTLMIDCSHGNSMKKHENQILVVKSVCEQLVDPECKNSIMGVMIESNINEGNQKLGDGKNLKYGVSVTDACINFEETITALELLSDAVEKRRSI
ncbi:hypothetical protein HK099_008527 [Clydaea vesicula]|uniref:Phospho-2-dehydro-3-deoxyheptonate aldolase n=1 Tax=Clydaea vesicula TaxID=447962 RepID=A0AAD5TXB5_9FUNG|nr:hypothetical protein HK099_008527 [Clydaea vesicula]KAJ3395656.1 hypothetical protein HDU92_005282 [Lobulomyces angularis]